jgi:hypothetical protein
MLKGLGLDISVVTRQGPSSSWVSSSSSTPTGIKMSRKPSASQSCKTVPWALTSDSQQELVFMHQLFDWKRLASESNESTEGFDQILMKLLESSAKGPRYHKAFGGRELSACAAVLREEVEAES